MTFKEAVEQTPQIAAAYKTGLSAFGDYSSKVVVPDKRLLGGSVDIDFATQELYPNNNRWDYAFDYKGESYFIEIHTASTSETSTVLRKLEWLKVWLREQAPKLEKLKSRIIPPFYWVQSKQYALPTHTPQYRMAVSAKLIPIKEWNYELLCRQHAPPPKSKKRVPRYLRDSEK
jgi:hypothetical protein